MHKHLRVLWFVLVVFVQTASFATGKRWLASGGFGLTFDPSRVLLSPQMEYPYQPNIWIGPLVQLAPGAVSTLFSVSANARVVLGDHPSVKPTFEAGVGIASIGSSLGAAINMGMGFDFRLERNIELGTMIRLNLVPSVATFFSWPLIIGRFLL